MRLFKLALFAVFCLLTQRAEAAGLQFISVPAELGDPDLQAVVWSPCAQQLGEIRVRNTTLAATLDCPVSGEKLPLIVISHGYGGSFISHHDTAEALADGGFVVVALNHPIDTGSSDMSRADTFAAFSERPADIKLLIDYMLAVWPDRAKLDPENIGFFGFSRGGYTGLVAAGANPDLRKATAFCQENSPKPSCAQLQRGELPTRAFAHDPRIKALVIADPAFGPLFEASGLESVKVPIQLWASELSGQDKTGGEVTFDFVSTIERDLPVKPDYRIVRDAGHFAFLTPCSPDLAGRHREICSDKPGFDRAAFHNEFNAAVLGFFRAHLQ